MLAQLLTRTIPPAHVLLYRLTRGRVGGRAARLPVLLLTTTGAKSGKRRTVPLCYLRDGPSYVVIGSNSGMRRHPGWCINLRKTPQALVQMGSARQRVRAEEAGPADRERLWAQVVARSPLYGTYQGRTTRQIPLVVLRPVDAS